MLWSSSSFILSRETACWGSREPNNSLKSIVAVWFLQTQTWEVNENKAEHKTQEDNVRKTHMPSSPLLYLWLRIAQFVSRLMVGSSSLGSALCVWHLLGWKEDGARNSSGDPANRCKGQWAHTKTWEIPFKHKKQLLFFYDEDGQALPAGCPESLWSVRPWRYPKLDRTWPWARPYELLSHRNAQIFLAGLSGVISLWRPPIDRCGVRRMPHLNSHAIKWHFIFSNIS